MNKFVKSGKNSNAHTHTQRYTNTWRERHDFSTRIDNTHVFFILNSRSKTNQFNVEQV